MVNENLVNLINKKPVELVQELKDYEIKKSPLSPAARSKVIKKYGGNYVSENKEDYGPCGWGNPNCECYIGSGFISLHLACPAGCDNTKAYSWTHSGCGGYMYISSRNIHLECKKCYTEGHWKEWSFACSKHPGQYVGATTDEFLSALGLATNLYPNKTREIKKLALNITIKLQSEGL